MLDQAVKLRELIQSAAPAAPARADGTADDRRRGWAGWCRCDDGGGEPGSRAGRSPVSVWCWSMRPGNDANMDGGGRRQSAHQVLARRRGGRQVPGCGRARRWAGRNDALTWRAERTLIQVSRRRCAAAVAGGAAIAGESGHAAGRRLMRARVDAVDAATSGCDAQTGDAGDDVGRLPHYWMRMRRSSRARRDAMFCRRPRAGEPMR